MGLFSWLFPSPADKVAKARRLLQDRRYAEARIELLDLTLEEVPALRREAEEGLLKLNLERAQACCRAGDDAQTEAALALAETFDPEGHCAEIVAETRKALAKLRQERELADALKRLMVAAKRRRELGPEPGDFTWEAFNGDGAIQLVMDGKDRMGLPRLSIQPDPAWFKPAGVTPPARPDAPTDAELLAAQQALLALYPQNLAPRVDQAGVALARAVLEVVSGRPERGVLALKDAPEDNPVIRFELARAACAMGEFKAAEAALVQFLEQNQGHALVGALHSKELAAQLLAWQGDRMTALALIGSLRAELPGRSTHLFTALAIETGHIQEAGVLLDELKAKNPADPRLPQLVAAHSLRAEVERLKAIYPVLRGEKAANAADHQRQLQEANQAINLALEAAMTHLPAPG